MRPARPNGFTLLELAIVLTIIALVTAMAITSGVSVVVTARTTATQQKMSIIEQALQQYRSTNERLPCPGDLTLAPGSADYGLEAGADAGSTIAVGTGVCTGTGMLPTANSTANGTSNTLAAAAEGAVPAVTLGLSPDFMVDGWGNKIRYAVDMSMTTNAAFSNTYAGCINGAITVNDANGNSRSSNAIYALISHGPNGHGAYTKKGTLIGSGSVNTNELTNCHCDSSWAVTTYAPTYVQQQQTLDPANAQNGFDDLVSYKERWQMQTAWDRTGSCPYVYVVDSQNGWVEKYDMGGNYKAQIGSYNVTLPPPPGAFNSPMGVMNDASGNLWVTDTTAGKLNEFTSSGTFLNRYTCQQGTGIAFDSGGNIWVGSSGANRVVKMNTAGVFQMQIGCVGSSPCASGTGNGQFDAVYGVAIDAGGNIWAADANNNRVQEFNSSGAWIRTIGGGASCTGCASTSSCTCNSGSALGMFNSPRAIAIDASGNIWVADANNQRIQEFSSTGTYMSEIGGGGATCSPSTVCTVSAGNCSACSSLITGSCYCQSGSSAAQFNTPASIALDKFGNVWIDDMGNKRIQKFTTGGTYRGMFGTAGSGAGQFQHPTSMTISR